VQWERDLAEKKARERTRELEWDRQVAQKRTDEYLREKRWKENQDRMQDEWERDLAERKVQEKEWEEKQEKERIREKQWNLDQEQRERLGLYWSQPVTGRCTAQGQRDYHAQLLNAAPYNYNWLQPCEDMPISIRGTRYRTSWCERVGDEIWGHWSLKDDSLCSPFFEDWRNNGCLASRSQRRLASARLDYIPDGEISGLEFCASTPNRFWDKYFPHPTTCAETNGHVWGYWEVEDDAC